MRLPVLLSGALLVACTRPSPKAPAPASEAPAAVVASAAASLPPRPKAWTVRDAHGVSVAVAADAQPESGPPPGDVRRGAAAASLADVFGADWPAGESWAAAVKPVDLGGRRFIQLTVTATAGEDVRTTSEQVALLPAAGGLRPVWRGPGRVEQVEMDQCTSGADFAVSVEAGALVITRKGFAEYQPPSEDENSQTPDFDAIKATCKPPRTVTERVKLTR